MSKKSRELKELIEQMKQGVRRGYNDTILNWRKNKKYASYDLWNLEIHGTKPSTPPYLSVWLFEPEQKQRPIFFVGRVYFIDTPPVIWRANFRYSVFWDKMVRSNAVTMDLLSPDLSRAIGNPFPNITSRGNVCMSLQIDEINAADPWEVMSNIPPSYWESEGNLDYSITDDVLAGAAFDTHHSCLYWLNEFDKKTIDWSKAPYTDKMLPDRKKRFILLK